jgi:hypothetical protein
LYFSLWNAFHLFTWYCGWCIGHTKWFMPLGVAPPIVEAGWVGSQNKRHYWWTVRRHIAVELPLHKTGASIAQMHWCAFIHTHGPGSLFAATRNPSFPEEAELTSSESDSSLGPPSLPPLLTSLRSIPLSPSVSSVTFEVGVRLQFN